MTTERTDPRFSADETAMLRSFLGHFRSTVRRQAEGLSAEQLAQTLGPSDLTLGGMLKHLAFVEDYWFSYNLAGNDYSEPWASTDWDSDPDWDWHSAAGASYDELVALLDEAIARSEACLDTALRNDPDLGQLVARPRRPERGGTASLRWVLIHMVEEYARHCGHADLIRQSIDGATDL